MRRTRLITWGWPVLFCAALAVLVLLLASSSKAAHEPQLSITLPQRVDQTATPTPCVLLVDDDDNNPDLRNFYIAALTTLNVAYSVFDVGGGAGNGPTASQMAPYPIVIWFSGDKIGSVSIPAAGPNATDENELTIYLNSGGHLFLDSQDYLADMGLTDFGRNQLGISSNYTNDGNSGATALLGQSADPIGQGYSSLAVSSPSGFTPRYDVVFPAGNARTAFNSSGGSNPGTSTNIDRTDNKTVFFTTAWTSVYYANNANGRALLGTILNFLGACNGTPIATPTNTPTPTRTPTPVTTLTPDPYEPNDTVEQAYYVAVGGQYTGINFVPYGVTPPPTDVDYFRAVLKNEHTYRIRTTLDGLGIDTYLRLIAPDGQTVLAENDDANMGTLASEIVWTVTTGRDETYYFQVTNRDPSDPSLPGKTYRFEVVDQSLTPGPSPTPTRTPSPGPTQIGGLDPYEPNYDFDHAYPIGAGTYATPGPTYAANFVPWMSQGPDNDFYVLTVKPGELYTCETFDLGAPTDTNMIFYDANRNGIGGNDDAEPGTRASRLSWYSTYLGPMYILIGNVGAVPPSQAAQYTYSLRCTFGLPPTPTPPPTNTPRPTLPPPPPTPVPTFTPLPPPPTLPPPPPTPLPTPTTQVIIIPQPTPTVGLRLVTVDLEVYYDANGNAAPDPGEGIVNLSARVYDATTNELLAYGFTDPDGRVSFTVAAPGPVRLEVPYLNYAQVITTTVAAVQIRVVSQPLPGGIP